MTSVSQNIPNYVSGMSEQPDILKFPGQVKDIINGIPDIGFNAFSGSLEDSSLEGIITVISLINYAAHGRK